MQTITVPIRIPMAMGRKEILTIRIRTGIATRLTRRVDMKARRVFGTAIARTGTEMVVELLRRRRISTSERTQAAEVARLCSLPGLGIEPSDNALAQK